MYFPCIGPICNPRERDPSQCWHLKTSILDNVPASASWILHRDWLSISISSMAVCWGSLSHFNLHNFITALITGSTCLMPTFLESNSITHIRTSSVYFPSSYYVTVVILLACNCFTSSNSCALTSFKSSICRLSSVFSSSSSQQCSQISSFSHSCISIHFFW